jgi:hypothetical protein
MLFNDIRSWRVKWRKAVEYSFAPDLHTLMWKSVAISIWIIDDVAGPHSKLVGAGHRTRWQPSFGAPTPWPSKDLKSSRQHRRSHRVQYQHPIQHQLSWFVYQYFNVKSAIVILLIPDNNAVLYCGALQFCINISGVNINKWVNSTSNCHLSFGTVDVNLRLRLDLVLDN